MAFGRMMLDKGQHGSERVLSRPSVELMTTVHLTPEQAWTSPSPPDVCLDFWTSAYEAIDD